MKYSIDERANRHNLQQQEDELKALNRVDDAIECFQSALEIHTPELLPLDCLKTARNLDNFAFKQGKWQLAIDTYNLAIKAVETSRTWATTEDERQLTTKITDDILTITTGFLCAGARSVISTLWAVDDLATALFSIFYYNNRYDGYSRAKSLKMAQVRLRNFTGEEFKLNFGLNIQFSHPTDCHHDSTCTIMK